MDKRIICFEGPSGIGKTTLSNSLSDAYHIIPEANILFEKTKEASEYWYYQRQVDRFERCKQSDLPSILDGDIFQPIWYNWSYHYPPEFLSKEAIHSFYKSMLTEKKIAFPDLYFIFHIEEEELRIRKEKDKTRRRRSFEKHLKFIEPQKQYYHFLDQETDINIQFIHYKDLNTARKEVLTAIERLDSKKVDDLKIFMQIEDWIDQNLPVHDLLKNNRRN